MDKFKRGLSLHKKKDLALESNKPYLWQEDERKVREGTCSFQVRYLGCIEVFESRGIQICEEAINLLKNSKSKPQRAVLYVAGDALRVVDELSKGLIVDQTIEKVSFCAPDRNNDKGFAYICRDGTTRRWMCHGFLAIKESGERLSHAVGCAFTICLEKKQLREKEKMTVTFSDNGTSFTRTGSFRQATLTERLADPQSAIVAEPVPLKKTDNPFAVERPKASVDLLHRQGSFSGFSRLGESSPFKRQMSLRLDELPSTLNRHEELTGESDNGKINLIYQQMSLSISPIPEASPSTERTDCISQICQQLSHGLLTSSSKPQSTIVEVLSNQTVAPIPPPPAPIPAADIICQQPTSAPVVWGHQVESFFQKICHSNDLHQDSDSIPQSAPALQSNVTTNPSTATGPRMSEADSWLNAIRDGMLVPCSTGTGVMVHSSAVSSSQMPLHTGALPVAAVHGAPNVSPFLISSRTSSMDYSFLPAHLETQQMTSTQVGFGGSTSNSWGTSAPSRPSSQMLSDPFDSEWAKLAASSTRNPFIEETISKSFELRL